MPSQISVAQLQDVSLFSNFKAEELEQILAVADDIAVTAGQPLFQTGETSRALYVLIEGKVAITFDAPGLDETLIAELAPKSIFGESSFFHAAPHSATATCMADSRLLRLTREEFDRLSEQNCLAALRLGANAADILASRMQLTDRWISELLEERHNAHLAAGWKRFRDHLGHAFAIPSSSGGFFSSHH